MSLILWQFYDETGIASVWGIKKMNFLFYFLFSVVVIPFQIVIDIMFYNIMNWYLKFDYLNSLNSWTKGSPSSPDFKEKGALHYWRGFSKENTKLEPKLRSLDQLGFSSQFYFLAMLGLSGNIMIIFGVMAIVMAKDNPYTDILTIVFLLGNQLILMLVEWVCMFLRKRFRIWETNNTVESKGREG